MNNDKLIPKLKQFKDTQKKLAELLGISQHRMSQKISGHNNGQFKQKEMKFIIDRYKLTPDEIYVIFFT